MAVKLKTINTPDRGKRPIDVHFIRLTKSNKKGISELVDGFVRVYSDGSLTIGFDSVYNGETHWVVVHKGDYVFRTAKNKRWQVANRADFLKRFPELKGQI